MIDFASFFALLPDLDARTGDAFLALRLLLKLLSARESFSNFSLFAFCVFALAFPFPFDLEAREGDAFLKFRLFPFNFVVLESSCLSLLSAPFFAALGFCLPSDFSTRGGDEFLDLMLLLRLLSARDCLALVFGFEEAAAGEFDTTESILEDRVDRPRLDRVVTGIWCYFKSRISAGKKKKKKDRWSKSQAVTNCTHEGERCVQEKKGTPGGLDA